MPGPDLIALVTKLDRLIEDVQKLGVKLEQISAESHQMAIWRAGIDERLKQGVQRMNALEALQKDTVSKASLHWLLAGVALGSGAGGAALMKMLGG